MLILSILLSIATLFIGIVIGSFLLMAGLRKKNMIKESDE